MSQVIYSAQNILKSSFILGVFLVCCLLPVMSHQVSAAPPARVVSSSSSATVYVTIPTGGKPATYVVGNKKRTVAPGKTSILPAGAVRIFLPKGTIITTSEHCEHCSKGIKNSYTVVEPVILAGMTPAAFKGNKQSIKPGLDASGKIKLPASLTDDHCICEIENQIKLPSKTIVDLIKVVSSASGVTVNPFNVLGDEVTDGNQP